MNTRFRFGMVYGIIHLGEGLVVRWASLLVLCGFWQKGRAAHLLPPTTAANLLLSLVPSFF
jgi:hypothetical protein